MIRGLFLWLGWTLILALLAGGEPWRFPPHSVELLGYPGYCEKRPWERSD